MADITEVVDITDEVGFDDIPLNVGDQYGIDDYWSDVAICEMENFNTRVYQEYQEYQQYGALWEEADWLAEMEFLFEQEEEQRFLDNNPMARLEKYVETIMEMGMYPDKHEYYEAMDIQGQDIIDEIVDQDIPKSIYDLKDSWD